MIRRLIIPAAALAAVAVPAVAYAHSFNHTVGCGGLTWNAANYQADQANSIVVTIDGAITHHDPSFGTTDTGTRTWTQTQPHTWSITVDAPGTSFDHSPSGTQQPCQSTTTSSIGTTTTTSTSIAPPDTPTSTTVTPTTTTTSTDQSSTSTTTTSTSVAVGEPPVPTTTSTIPPTPPPTSPAPAEPLDSLPSTGLRSDPWVPFTIFLVGCFFALCGTRRGER